MILDREAGGARGRAAASPGSDGKRTIKLLSAKKQVGDRLAKSQPPDPMHRERSILPWARRRDLVMLPAHPWLRPLSPRILPIFINKSVTHGTLQHRL